MKLPKFEKSTDDRSKKKHWFNLKQKPEIVILEGWCVGAKPQLNSLIRKPLNNLDKIRSFIDNQYINQYMSFIVDRLFAANKYFNDQEPWKKKDDRLRLNTIVYTALELIRKITILLYPVIPETSVKVLSVFNETENSIDFTSIDNNEILKKNLKINKLDILFKKIEK